jgi:hypothetical protein
MPPVQPFPCPSAPFLPFPTAIDTTFTCPSTGEPLQFVESAVTGKSGALAYPSGRRIGLPVTATR